MKFKLNHKYKLNHKFKLYLFCILCIFILIYYFFRVKKEKFQSFLQKQIDIRNLKSKLKSLSKSNNSDKCLTKIDCYNKLLKYIYNDFMLNLLKQVNPNSILKTNLEKIKKVV